MPARARNFLVREQILEFHRRLQADRLKPVARPPMTQGDLSANLVRVKKFAAALPAQIAPAFSHFKIPMKLDAVEIHLPCPVRQINDEFIDFESDSAPASANSPCRPTSRVTEKFGLTLTKTSGERRSRSTKSKSAANTKFRQLQLQHPPLNRDWQFVKMQETPSGSSAILLLAWP